jgi:hypothetical protein
MLNGHIRFKGEKESMPNFAERLASITGGPILDATGLKGRIRVHSLVDYANSRGSGACAGRANRARSLGGAASSTRPEVGIEKGANRNVDSGPRGKDAGGKLIPALS